MRVFRSLLPGHSGARRSREPGIHRLRTDVLDSRFRALRGPGMTMAMVFTLVLITPAHARLDLSNASVERLDNGLTLIMLEDRTFPVVSVQTTYNIGAKDDPAGRLGLAHFFEHMAFRGSKNFPGLGLTSEIYAAGGEWHGYTWIDNTNYFATAPKAELPLLLDIDADRMARLELRKEDIEAERGAVLAEMNGYANDPDSTLFDALMPAHFLTHPYRNNTIGYASDIGAITHQDVVDFYERNYAPQNAVLAIVGDFDREAARALVKKKFGKIKKKISPRAPLTAELPRSGERRVTISLPSDEKLFKIAWPAPAASHPDFPAFLVLQALIGEPSGVNFNQNDWGTPVGPASPIADVAKGLRTWIIPTAEPYAFVVSGSTAKNGDAAKIENAIQREFDNIAKASLTAEAVTAAKQQALNALAFDIDTMEEAAHQLAYFASIGALDRFMTLEKDIDAVSADRIQEVAYRYLRADQRTIAWLQPGPTPIAPAAATAREIQERKGAADRSKRFVEPALIYKDGRPPAFFVRSELSDTVAIKAYVNRRLACDACVADDLAFDTTTISASAPAADFASAFVSVISNLEAATAKKARHTTDDPLARLEEEFAYLTGFRNDKTPEDPYLRFLQMFAVSGAVDPETVEAALIAHFPKRDALEIEISRLHPFLRNEDVDVRVDKPLAQEAVGYIAEMQPGEHQALAARIAVYILSHGYGGRLGVEAISRRGLAYYIDADYRAGIGAGLVTLAAGVDPEKVDAFRDLMKAEIARVKFEPPTAAEIAEAKRHLLGRKISAAQSNEEIAEAMIRDFLAVGRPESEEDFAARLNSVTRVDILNAVDALQKGAVVTVRAAGVN